MIASAVPVCPRCAWLAAAAVTANRARNPATLVAVLSVLYCSCFPNITTMCHVGILVREYGGDLCLVVGSGN